MFFFSLRIIIKNVNLRKCHITDQKTTTNVTTSNTSCNLESDTLQRQHLATSELNDLSCLTYLASTARSNQNIGRLIHCIMKNQ